MKSPHYLDRIKSINLPAYKKLKAMSILSAKEDDENLTHLIAHLVEKTYFLTVKKKSYDVLVCDDNAEVLESISTEFRLQGFTVDTANSVAQLQEKLQTNFHISLFVDINLPAGPQPETMETAWASLYDFRTKNNLSNIYIVSAFAQEMSAVLGHPDLKIKANIQKPFFSKMLIPYLKADCQYFKILQKEIENHPLFNLGKWKTQLILNYCQERLQLVDGDIKLAADLCHVSERTIRRALNRLG